jgi:uncharacterized membrane protein
MSFWRVLGSLLRVAFIIVWVTIISSAVIFVFLFLFVFFLAWLVSKEGICD